MIVTNVSFKSIVNVLALPYVNETKTRCRFEPNPATDKEVAAIKIEGI